MTLTSSTENLSWDHCHESQPVLKDHILLTEDPTFQCNWSCHRSPPVLRDRIFMANGAVLLGRFYCMHAIYTPETQVDFRLFFSTMSHYWVHQYECYIYSWGPNFHTFCSTISCFQVINRFCEKCTERPPKYQYVCYCIYTAEAQIFGLTLWKTHQMTQNFQGQRYTYYINPRSPNFHPFHSTTCRFQGRWDFWIPHKH